MSDEELAKRIKAECNSGDNENDHYNADTILIVQLKELGYEKDLVKFLEERISCCLCGFYVK